MRFVQVEEGHVVAINAQGRWAFSMTSMGRSRWAVREMDKFGNRGRLLGYYSTVAQAKERINNA